jgi:hypothetical protein
MVGATGIEPVTPTMSRRFSAYPNHLICLSKRNIRRRSARISHGDASRRREQVGLPRLGGQVQMLVHARRVARLPQARRHKAGCVGAGE